MAIQYVNIGINPNDGTGDDLRTAFLKVNDNFQLLATIGGETNIGENLGGGGGQVYAGKVNETLQFKTIAAGTGININQTGQVITISNPFTAPIAFTSIVDDSNNSYVAQTAGSSVKILGDGTLATNIQGNEVHIINNYRMSDDVNPSLGGNLTLNNFDITGTGDISIIGDSTTDTLTVGRIITPGVFPGSAQINGTLNVQGTSTLKVTTATTINASTSITSPVINGTASVGFVGNLSGTTTGTHYGNVAIKVSGQPDVVVINGATAPATIDGTHIGSGSFVDGFTGKVASGGIDINSNNIFGTGSISVSGTDNIASIPFKVDALYHPGAIDAFTPPPISNSNNSALLTMAQQTFGVSGSLRLRSTSTNSNQTMPLGTSIMFESVNTLDPLLPGYSPTLDQPEYMLHGQLGILNYQEWEQISADALPDTTNKHSTFVVRVRANQIDFPDATYLNDVIVARGNGLVSIASVDFSTSRIVPSKELNVARDAVVESTNDLILATNRSDTYINFYGDYADGVGPAIGGYSYPKDIGLPGQVLSVHVPTGGGDTWPTNLLEWITPGSGGGASATSFLNLSDTPANYTGSANRIVAVNSSGNGLTFVTSINATLTGNVTGNVTGNASTATALQNTRTINGFNFNGTQNVVIDTRQIEEYRQTATGATIGVGAPAEAPVTSITISIPDTNIPPGTGGAQKFVLGMLIVGSGLTGDVVITNISSTGGTTTITASCDSQIVIETAGVNITGEVVNKWFSVPRVRQNISVINGTSLTYNSTTGEFNISESVSNAVNTLVKRDANGETFLSTLNVTEISKNALETAITISSPVETSETIDSTANITTTATVSAGFIELTGTGDQTIASTAKIVLNPATSVDVSSKPIINLPSTAPVNNTDAASKKYVDDTAGAVQTASLQSLTVAGNTSGSTTLTKSDTLTIKGPVDGNGNYSGNIITQTTSTGIEISLRSTLSGISISGNLPVGSVTATGTVKGGNITISGNEITQTIGSNALNLVPSNNGSVNVNGGSFKLLNSRLHITGWDIAEFAANQLEGTISITTATTFIRTFNWPEEGGGLAYAFLPSAGVEDGQIKTIIMKERGNYGNALDTRPRYLVLRGVINGSERTMNIAASDPNGSSTFIFLDGSWWRTANVA